MRKYIIGIAALLLSACGGETYQVAPSEAFSSLSSIGMPPGMDPLPGGLDPVNVRFESVPGDNKVQWFFTHNGEDLARIEAVVTPSGDKSSTVTVNYISGTAPDQNWRNGDARRLIENQIQRLVVEAVDSKLENRPFDVGLKQAVSVAVTTSSLGAMMGDASAAMDEAVKNQRGWQEEAEAARAQSEAAREARDVGKPSTDLSGGSR